MKNKKEVTTNDIMEFLQKQNGEMDKIMERLDVLQNQMTNVTSTMIDVTSTMATKNDMKQLDQRITIVDQKISELDRKIYANDKKFESKFDLLFDAIGELKENFTIMDYKFIFLKRQVLAT